MSDHIPGWLEGQRPAPLDRFISRAALIERSTLTRGQVNELVKTGRLTPHRVPANRRIAVFAVSEVDAVFAPITDGDA